MSAPSVRVEFVVGDLLAQPVDALVNAANEHLVHGGGVAGALARGAGPEFLREARGIGGCPVGGAVITGGGDLPQRWVIHAVGPRWAGGRAGEDRLLGACHRAAIALAHEHGVARLALPAISTGIFGYPVERAAPVAVGAVCAALAEAPTVHLVRFCFLDESTRERYRAACIARSPVGG
ncbi:MAG TPA: macro domain-containing protein [Miltoncostaeaceae bacterium]|nr:macro domain-containing protein [Miltoncostaeaceae bacterium]